LRSRAAELAAAPDSPEVVPEASVPRSQDAAWRDELSARLSRYRARRKVRPPRYPSLSLQFELPVCPNAGGSSQLPEFVPVSDHALALDEMRREPFAAAAEELAFRHPPVAEAALHPAHSPTGHLPEHSSGSSSSGSSSAQAFGNVSANSRAQGGAKIIEFPRSAWGPPPPPLDQLAEPVSERPRILEVPEVAPPPPALGGITIEAAEHEDAERRPGIDIPLQSAPLGLRLLAALVDGLIVAAASAVFGVIFWKVAAVRPPLAQILSLAVGIPCLFLPAYQYLLIVYAASTPGWRAAGLEPCAAGACWPPACPVSLSAWATHGCFSTRTPSAGTIASRIPTSVQESEQLRPYRSPRKSNCRTRPSLPLCYLQWFSLNCSLHTSSEAWPPSLKVQNRQ
jgi:hypothetical protein